MTALRVLSIACLLLLPLHGAPSSASGTIAAGTEWETSWFIRDSGQPGPTVLITGGIHGDEPAGARAAEHIRHWPIRKGRLIVLPRANVPGLKAGTRRLPGAKDPAQDLNRNFPRLKQPDTVRGEPARAIWTFVRSQKPGWLIDLHEGYHFHRIQPKSVGSSIIHVKSEKANTVAPLMLKAVDATIEDPEKKFSRLSPPANGSLARAAAVHLGAEALILETTRKDQSLAHRARQHRIMVHTLLTHLDMVAPDTQHLAAPEKQPATTPAHEQSMSRPRH